ncbi:MAG: 3-hydroxyacyl-ACP dehydratase [Chitinophagales bacterium]
MNSDKYILKYIPQRGAMVMVDELIFADESVCKTRFTVSPGNIFVEDEDFSAAGLIENMAQTAAARMGYICFKEQRPVPIGFIAAVQNFQAFALPKINEQIETEISIKNQIFDFTIVSGTVHSNGKKLAQCDLKIYISKQT